MNEANIELLKKATDAINAGDLDTFLSLHAPDVKLHIVGRHPAAGEFQGREGATEAFQRLAEILDGPPVFDLHDVLANDTHGVLLGTQRYIRGGKTLDSETTVVLRLRDGLATEVWVSSNDPYAEDAFLS